MELYVAIMYTLSFFGFFIIFISLYLLFNVPTKLNSLSQFAIHGHDIVSGVCQIYLTIGTTPVILLPCAAGYTNGLMSYFGLIGALEQIWTIIAVVATSGGFTLLLSIIRVFAVYVKVVEKTKNSILKFYFGQLICQIVFIIALGQHSKDGGEEGRQVCKNKVPFNYPQIMYSTKAVHLIFSRETGFVFILIYMIVFPAIYLLVGIICGIVLIRSLKAQSRSTQSVQFLANQQRLTKGVVYLTLFELFGLGLPIIIASLCALLSKCTPFVAEICIICMCIYPIFGSYHVLMSNSDYRKRVEQIARIVLFNRFITTVNNMELSPAR